ncbi:MAG: DedA family protein [Deltaproteobacteria bacterium]|nr:DedA family protein [Deltaproteobacteria bacterium]
MLVTAVICYTSILLGDLVAWNLGRRYGRLLTRHIPFRWFLPESRIHRVERWFQRFGNWTVFFGRMVAGVRFVTFVIAGMARMPVSRFILFDSIGALVTVPLWLVLGYVLGTHFDQIVQWMSRISTTTWILVGAVVLLLLLWKLAHRKHKAHEEMPE